MATKLSDFTNVRHPYVFERVYLYSGAGGSLQSTISPEGGPYVYRNQSKAIEELAKRLLREESEMHKRDQDYVDVTIRLPKAQLNELLAAATDEDMTLSQYIARELNE